MESNFAVESRDRCDVLIEEIKKKDEACQGFRVVIEADEIDYESDETKVTDEGDGSWEIVGTEASAAAELIT